jgi:TonB family protein
MSTDIERMDDRTFYYYAHPLRRRRFYLALVFATLLFPLVALGLIAGTIFLIVPLIALLVWISTRVFFARLMGDAVLVSKLNYPRVDTIAEELKVKLAYDKRIFIFVYESPSFNASLSHLFFRRAIFLNSEILEAGVSDDEVRWLVGRFIGYLRTRKQAGALGWLIRAAQYLLVFNLFLLPYERAMVYTGDRLAVAAIRGNVSSALSALQKIFVGRQLGYSLNPEGIIEQQREVKGSFFAFLARLASGFPLMTMRYVDLIVFAKAYFPSEYARFVAANPSVPEDLPRLAATSDEPAPALNERTRVKSGIAVGWAVCALVLAAVTLPVISVSSRIASTVAQSRLSNDSSAQLPAEPDASQPPASPDTPANAEQANAPAAAEQEPVAHTLAAVDPTHPIPFDDFYPAQSKRSGEQGRCVVQVTVKKDGRVTNPVIATSTGFARLDAACVESMRNQQMLPSTENGAPIEETVLIPIDWQLN